MAANPDSATRRNERKLTWETISIEEAWENWEAQVRTQLGMSGDEFIAAYQAGRWPDDDLPETMHIGRLGFDVSFFAPWRERLRAASSPITSPGRRKLSTA